MKEVILNDKCAHCNHKECHDGEHFCNQAMKENSFYKNAKLYKGLEVIQRPTYEELAKENAELKLKLEALEGQTPWKDIKDKNELIKENAELKCECKRCIHTDCPCVPSDYGKDRNGICDHFKDVFDEIVELNDELKKWKDEWQEQVQKATDEGYARTLQTVQLSKARDIIKNLMLYVPVDLKEYEEAEQFLKSEDCLDIVDKYKKEHPSLF